MALTNHIKLARLMAALGLVIALYAEDTSAAGQVTNPNLNEWNLINLTPANVSAASGGRGVKIAVMDGQTDCRNTDVNLRCTNVLIPGGVYTKYNAHGSHTAGIIASNRYGVATSATVINYAVFDDTKWIATGTRLIDAWRRAHVSGASIASMSFGCTGIALCFSASELATMGSAASPMLFVKAAGNAGVALRSETTAVNAKAATDALNRTLLVGSVDAKGIISSFSNRPGEGCLLVGGATHCQAELMWKNHFLVAPGEAIYSNMPDRQYSYMTGTSMATPVVAGAAALLQARWPRLKQTPDVLAKILLTTATDLGVRGIDSVYGYGLLNVAAAFRANGVVTIQGQTGPAMVVSGTITSTNGTMSKLAHALADVTVFDRFGRDFPLAETGALQIVTGRQPRQPQFGRRLIRLAQQDSLVDVWSNSSTQPLAVSQVGRREATTAALSFDRSLHIGFDLPFDGGLTQFRLTGSGDARLGFAQDSSLHLLANFPSTSLLDGTVLANTTFRMTDAALVMVYGFVTTGPVYPVDRDPVWTSLPTDRTFALREEEGRGSAGRRQVGGGTSMWLRPDSRSLIGLNMSAQVQRGGYYNLESDLAAFRQPTGFFSIGALGRRQFKDWSVSVSGEMSHLQMNGPPGALSVTPTKFVSAELTLQLAKLAFRDGGVRDRLALALTMPPRAVAGNLRLDYLAPTADRLDLTPVSRMVPVSNLGRDPLRVEFAYGLSKGALWSFSLSGGTDLEAAPEAEGTNLLARIKLAL